MRNDVVAASSQGVNALAHGGDCREALHHHGEPRLKSSSEQGSFCGSLCLDALRSIDRNDGRYKLVVPSAMTDRSGTNFEVAEARPNL